jgi:hypothetical protein
VYGKGTEEVVVRHFAKKEDVSPKSSSVPLRSGSVSTYVGVKSMISRVTASLAAMLIALSLVAPASAATKIFLMGGQSNMAGVGGYAGYLAPNTYPWSMPPYDHADAPCPSPYNQPLDSVKFWNYTTDTVGADLVHNPGTGNGWISLQNGYGYRTDQFGPELGFGARLRELYPDDEIYIVKLGITSTSLGGNWNPNGSGATYNLFKQRVNAAIGNLVGQGKTPQIAGMVWMQGEEDSTISSYAPNYTTNIANFVSTVRNTYSAYDAQNMKFVAGRITYMTQLWASRSQIDLVRDAQGSIASHVAKASCVNTDDLEWGYYGHYGTQGQIDLGNRFANQFATTPQSLLAIASQSSYSVAPYSGSTEDISAQGNLDWVITARSEKEATNVIATDGSSLLQTTPHFTWLPNLTTPKFNWTGGLNHSSATNANAGYTYCTAESEFSGTHIDLPAGSGQITIWWCRSGTTGNAATCSFALEDGTLLTTDAVSGTPAGRKTVIDYYTAAAQTLTFTTNDDAGVYAIAVSVVPEPGTLVLLASAALGLLVCAWRRR